MAMLFISHLMTRRIYGGEEVFNATSEWLGVFRANATASESETGSIVLEEAFSLMRNGFSRAHG